MVRIFEAYIFGSVSVKALELTNTSSLAIKVSTEEVLVVLFACEICHRSICSKFVSFACESHGTIIDTLYINKLFEQFCLILTCHWFVK